jgi:hypothetical protein
MDWLPNRVQAMVLGFFVAVWIALVVILVAAPDIFDRALRLGAGDHGTADLTFLIAITAFLAVLSVGVLRRSAWVFWLILVAFLAGILRIPVALLELMDVISADDPSWYIVFQGALGGVQFAIGLSMLTILRRTGIRWGEPSASRGRDSGRRIGSPDDV